MSSIATLQPLPHSTRSQVFTALMTFLQATVPPPKDPITNKPIPFQTYSQLLRQWDDLSNVLQPAMFIRRGPQMFESKHVFGVTKLSFKVSVWIYFRTDGYRIDPNYPDQLTDPFIDGLEQAFQSPTPTPQRQTLNGTVYHCFIDGQIYSDPGLTDSQAVIIVPLTILL